MLPINIPVVHGEEFFRKIIENKFGVFKYIDYICLIYINNHIIMSEKLKVQSTFESTERMSFNEWAVVNKVSSMYVEPVVLFEGNPKTNGLFLVRRKPSFISKIIKLIKELS